MEGSQVAEFWKTEGTSPVAGGVAKEEDTEVDIKPPPPRHFLRFLKAGCAFKRPLGADRWGNQKGQSKVDPGI